MLHFTRLLFATLAFFCSNLLFSQSTNNKIPVQGTLIEQSSGDPLPYATVILYNQQDSSMASNDLTDLDGNFSLPVAPGDYYAVLQFIGFADNVVPDISVTPGVESVVLGQIFMSSDATVLDEIEVIAERSQMEFKLDRRVFNVAKDLTNGGNSAADILDNVPSVSVDPEGNVSLRGSQGVRILINGKPSGMLSAGDTKALLRMQGDIIESIEVITNPSARYEAEGEAGIINIILKKNQEKGVNGSFGATVGYPQNYGLSYNLNYRKKDFNFFSNFGVDYRKSPGGGEATQRFFDNGNLTEFYSTTTDQTRASTSGYLQMGTDWILNPQNTITGSLLYRAGRGDNNSMVTYRDFDGNENITNLTLRDIAETENSQNLEASVSYTKTFEQKDREWTVVVKYILDDDTELADYDQTDNDSPIRLLQLSSNTEDERNFLFQTDYVYPIGDKSKVEGGLRMALRTVNNNFQVQQNDNGTFDVLPGFDDELLYTEDIYAGYLIGAHEFGAFSSQVGLRAELSDITASLLKSEQTNDQNYFNLFPSASLAYKFSAAKQLQVSYSRRLSRPYFRRLLPFSNFNNPRNINTGNPNLRPEFTDAFELGYLQYLTNGSFLSSVYYRRTTGVIERLVLPGEEEGTTLVFPVNLSARDAYGLEFNFSYQFAKWWDINTDLNFYREQVNGQFQERDYSSDTYTWSGRINNKFKVSKPLQVQASFRYNAPQNTTQGRRLSSYALDVAASLDVFSGKGTLTLSGRDLFNTRIRRSEVNLPNYQEESFFQWRQTRQVIMTFSYRLNQSKQRGGGGEGGDRGEGDGDF